jgi:thioredoxin 1
MIAGCVVVVMLLAQIGEAASLDDALAQARKESKIVMLELGSVGCIPCEQMRPVMDKLSRNYKGRLEVIFVDVKKDRKPAIQFQVYGIPTQVFLDRSGKEFHRHIGFYAYEEIEPMLKKAGL